MRKCIGALVAGAAALSIGCLSMTQASAATVIVKKVLNQALDGGLGGYTPFTPSENTGAITPQTLWETPGLGAPGNPDLCTSETGCTYDFEFQLSGFAAADKATVRIEAQARSGGEAQDVSFDVFSGTPVSTGPTPLGSATHVGSSNDSSPEAPVITLHIGLGSFYIQIAPSQIAVDREIMIGSLTLISVPEPTAWALMLVGLGGVGLALRRRGPDRRLIAMNAPS